MAWQHRQTTTDKQSQYFLQAKKRCWVSRDEPKQTRRRPLKQRWRYIWWLWQLWWHQIRLLRRFFGKKLPKLKCFGDVMSYWACSVVTCSNLSFLKLEFGCKIRGSIRKKHLLSISFELQTSWTSPCWQPTPFCSVLVECLLAEFTNTTNVGDRKKAYEDIPGRIALVQNQSVEAWQHSAYKPEPFQISTTAIK